METEGVFLNARVPLVQEQRGGASSHDYYSATDILIIRFNVVVMLDNILYQKHLIYRQCRTFSMFEKKEVKKLLYRE